MGRRSTKGRHRHTAHALMAGNTNGGTQGPTRDTMEHDGAQQQGAANPPGPCISDKHDENDTQKTHTNNKERENNNTESTPGRTKRHRAAVRSPASDTSRAAPAGAAKPPPRGRGDGTRGVHDEPKTQVTPPRPKAAVGRRKKKEKEVGNYFSKKPRKRKPDEDTDAGA